MLEAPCCLRVVQASIVRLTQFWYTACIGSIANEFTISMKSLGNPKIETGIIYTKSNRYFSTLPTNRIEQEFLKNRTGISTIEKSNRNFYKSKNRTGISTKSKHRTIKSKKKSNRNYFQVVNVVVAGNVPRRSLATEMFYLYEEQSVRLRCKNKCI